MLDNKIEIQFCEVTYMATSQSAHDGIDGVVDDVVSRDRR